MKIKFEKRLIVYQNCHQKKYKTKTKSKKKKKRQKLFFLRNNLFFTADQDCDNDSTYNGMEHSKWWTLLYCTINKGIYRWFLM